MEPLPQSTPSIQALIEDFFKPPRLYGVLALVLIGATSCFFVVTYLDGTRTPTDTQAAAANTTVDAFVGISLSARSAIVYDMATGRTLFERNADTQLPLASITKVMLALVVVENLPLDTVITIPYAAPSLGLGDKWEVGELIKFTLVASSNQGAEILAAAAESAIEARFPGAPAEDATIWRMNQLADELGMSKSYFLNASGLDISATESGGYASARDVAKLFAYAASSSLHVLSATTENGVLITHDGGTTEANNTNEALGDIPGLIMGKTGFTDLAGGNLAVVYDIGLAHPIVAVVMGSSRDGRFEDMRKLVPASRAAITQ